MGKKVAIICVSSFFLVAMVVAAVVVGVNRHPSSTKSGDDLSATAKAVQTLCQPTDYKEACIKSLASANTTEPKELMKLAFKAAMHEVALALNNSTMLQKANTDNKTGQSLSICNRALDTAIDSLQQSFDKIGASDLSKVDDYMNDVQTWLSASYSCGVMCIDAFEWNTAESDKAKAEMEKALKSAKELTNNALAMVNQIEKVSAGSLSLRNLNVPVSESTSRRRLLSDDGFPNWMNAGIRRLLKTPAKYIRADVIVAKDGSGQYTKVSDAVKNIPVRPDNRTYIMYVKAGVYDEIVTVEKKHSHVIIIGDGPDKTKITGMLNKKDGVETFYTGTFKTFAPNFIAREIGFENTAGSEKHQAVALHVEGDMSIIYNCRIDGFQDTLLTSLNRQFYRDCTISGTVDFIFGYGSAIFQNCNLLIRKPLLNQQCIVTADGRETKQEISGIVIHNSTITPAPDMALVKHNFKSYIGRPWRHTATTLVINSKIDDVIHPDGWMPWEGNNNHKSCVYGEYGNQGLGADTSRRVEWSIKLTKNQALLYTVQRFIDGSKWIPRWIPYVAGL